MLGSSAARPERSNRPNTREIPDQITQPWTCPCCTSWAEVALARGLSFLPVPPRRHVSSCSKSFVISSVRSVTPAPAIALQLITGSLTCSRTLKSSRIASLVQGFAAVGDKNSALFLSYSF